MDTPKKKAAAKATAKFKDLLTKKNPKGGVKSRDEGPIGVGSGPSKGGPSKGGPSTGGPSKGGPSKGGPSKGGPV